MHTCVHTHAHIRICPLLPGFHRSPCPVAKGQEVLVQAPAWLARAKVPRPPLAFLSSPISLVMRGALDQSSSKHLHLQHPVVLNLPLKPVAQRLCPTSVGEGPDCLGSGPACDTLLLRDHWRILQPLHAPGPQL